MAKKIESELCVECCLNPRYRHYRFCLDCRNKERKEKRANDPEWHVNELQKRNARNARQPACTQDGCLNPSIAKGLCTRHAQDARRNDPDAERCSNGCDRPITAKGLCNSCYNTSRREDAGLGLCDVGWCERNSYARGLCTRHYRQTLAHHIEPDELVALVFNGCHACGSIDRLQIDHDHSCCDDGDGQSCGKCIRGALCGAHNAAFGYMNDDPEQVRLLLDYAISTHVISVN